jgi:hypothetical protein
MIPTHAQILSFYDALPDDDKSPKGLLPHTAGRQVYCEWFLDNAGESYTTLKGVVKSGHTPMRLRGLYLLEKALNARHRELAQAHQNPAA